MGSKRHRFGLWGKLVLAILAAGTIPIVVGLSVAYVKGTTELQDVIGASFQALAEDSASKVDAEIQRIIAADRLLARQATADPGVRKALLSTQPGGEGSPAAPTRFDWPSVQQAEDSKWILRASWVTGLAGGPIWKEAGGSASSREKMAARVSGLRLGGETQRYLGHGETPVPTYSFIETK